MLEHCTGVVGNEAAGLGPKIEEDSIRFPVAKGADRSLVNTRDEESGSTTRVEAVSFDAIRRDVSDVIDGASSVLEFNSNVAGCDVMEVMQRVVVVIDGAIRRGVVLAEMVHMLLYGADGAKGVVAGETMAQGFPLSGVLLIGVGEGDEGPLLHVIPRVFTGGDVLGK